MPKKVGRIKSGEGTLIGNAGEYYVVAELLKRGVIAALAPRNAPAFDILATKGSRTVRVRVKTKSAQYSGWKWMVKKDGTIFRDLGGEDDFTVLVNLTQETRDLEFFVVPTSVIDKWIRSDFEEWVRTPGKNGRPHDPTNRLRDMPQPKHAEKLAEYANNWGSMWE